MAKCAWRKLFVIFIATFFFILTVFFISNLASGPAIIEPFEKLPLSDDRIFDEDEKSPIVYYYTNFSKINGTSNSSSISKVCRFRFFFFMISFLKKLRLELKK